MHRNIQTRHQNCTDTSNLADSTSYRLCRYRCSYPTVLSYLSTQLYAFTLTALPCNGRRSGSQMKLTFPRTDNVMMSCTLVNWRRGIWGVCFVYKQKRSANKGRHVYNILSKCQSVLTSFLPQQLFSQPVNCFDVRYEHCHQRTLLMCWLAPS
jgi:hypothetical protein